MGSYAIIGAHLMHANGAAWSAQMRGTDQVAVAFFGDGTTNIGAFHEALNMAEVWNLPAVFVCENNLYMEYTPIDVVTPVAHPAVGSGVRLRAARACWSTATTPTPCTSSAERRSGEARAGGGPSLIEAITYRSGGHSRADPGKYRPPEEVGAWAERDPIPHYRARLLTLGVAEDELEAIDEEVAERIDAATEFAKAGAEPGESSLLTEVYADGGSRWRN